MNPKRRQKLMLIIMLALGLSLVCGLVLYALRQNISLFYTPSDIQAGSAPFKKRIRLGGMVVPGSIQRDQDSLKILFDLTDYKHKVNVQFHGILPDLFREGQGVVTTGFIDKEGQFMATEVLAKHDENYMPPEVKQSLARQATPESL